MRRGASPLEGLSVPATAACVLGTVLNCSESGWIRSSQPTGRPMPGQPRRTRPPPWQYAEPSRSPPRTYLTWPTRLRRLRLRKGAPSSPHQAGARPEQPTTCRPAPQECRGRPILPRWPEVTRSLGSRKLRHQEGQTIAVWCCRPVGLSRTLTSEPPCLINSRHALCFLATPVEFARALEFGLRQA
jgi:hypothetical protein